MAFFFLMKAATRPQNFLFSPVTAVLFGALSYKNGRDSIYKAKRIDGKDFSGWGIPFKAIQDSPKNEADIKREFYHILIGLHFQREVAETRISMCWNLLSSYYLENWEENRRFGLLECKLSSINQTKFPASISIWNKLIAVVLTLFPLSTLWFRLL